MIQTHQCSICAMECLPRFSTCNACYYAFMKHPSPNLKSYDKPNTITVYGGAQFADTQSNEMGASAENAFLHICKKNGILTRPATKTENCVHHFDIVLLRDGVGYKVDIKSMKSPKRGMPPDPNLIYLELRNVNGDDGWLYGCANYIAFQQDQHCFWMVPRNELVLMVDKMLENKCCKTVSVSGIPRSLYSRKNRQDLLMILSRQDPYLQKCQGCFVFE